MGEKRINALLAGIAEAKKEQIRFQPIGEEWHDARFPADEGYSFWLNAVPIRIFPGCALPKSLSKREKGLLLDCAMLMEAGSNMLCKRVDGYYKPINAYEVGQRVGMNERRTKAFINRMCDMGIMAVEYGRTYINPCYFFRGKHLSYHLYSLFSEDLRSVLPEWVVKRYENGV